MTYFCLFFFLKQCVLRNRYAVSWVYYYIEPLPSALVQGVEDQQLEGAGPEEGHVADQVLQQAVDARVQILQHGDNLAPETCFSLTIVCMYVCNIPM